jgi:hypothetical protein
MVGATADGADAHGEQSWQRVRAASRVVGQDVVVCAVGWDTEVHTLGGAARVVWDVAVTPHTRSEMAAEIGLDDDDPHLGSAVELLTRSGLLRPVSG